MPGYSGYLFPEVKYFGYWSTSTMRSCAVASVYPSYASRAEHGENIRHCLISRTTGKKKGPSIAAKSLNFLVGRE
ncbi:hypothetical protein P3T40_002913 [Paraburkholderia sp. EB58]|jgi:hypothetical protein